MIFNKARFLARLRAAAEARARSRRGSVSEVPKSVVAEIKKNVQQNAAAEIKNVQQNAAAEIKNVKNNATEVIESMENTLKRVREKSWRNLNERVKKIKDSPVTKADIAGYLQQHLKRPEQPTAEERERLGFNGARKKYEDEYTEAYKTLNNEVSEEISKTNDDMMDARANRNLDLILELTEKKHKLFGIYNYLKNEINGKEYRPANYQDGGRRGRGKTIKQRGKKGRGRSRRR
jgi:hypothetical protein